MEQHPATEAPQMKVEADGTSRPETEQERITRIQTAMQSMTDRAYGRPLPGSIDLAEYLGRSDFRPGDIVEYKDERKGTTRTAECVGRDDQNIFIRFHDTNTQTRVHYTQIEMIQKGDGHPDAPILITPPAGLPTRAEAAAEFVEAIISHEDAVAHLKLAAAEEESDLLDLPIQLLNADAKVPTQARHGDAGYDLHASESAMVYRSGRSLVGTGIAVAIPLGYVGFIKPRSGLAHKHGINVLGGVIDAGYRGEVKVILHNTSDHSFPVAIGDRIAQLVIQPVAAVGFRTTDTLPDSERQQHGFGSTGQ